uniref:Uncharacterized protein n=1 Tax=Anguilla anguilla TaxID=7936 RepID=A0A0E9R4I4_ANGAN
MVVIQYYILRRLCQHYFFHISAYAVSLPGFPCTEMEA